MKYRPDFPDRFGCQEDARLFVERFMRWYNHDHHHSGLGLHTPADVHFGLAESKRERRAEVLAQAQAAHPERFVRGTPRPPSLPQTVWINPPKTASVTAAAPSAEADAEDQGSGGGPPAAHPKAA